MSRSSTSPALPVAPGSRGEIAVRGIGLMAGYLDDPEATVATMRGEWLATGDVGWIGEDGNLRIVDRLKDMVVVGGFNVYPAEVERVLLEHVDVSQAAVIGLPDARMGEVPGAFVVPAPGAAIDVETLVDFLGAAAGEVQGAPHRVGGRPAPDERGGQGGQGGAAVRRRHPPGLLATLERAAPRSRTLDAPRRVDPLRLALLGEGLGAFLLVGVAPHRDQLFGPGFAGIGQAELEGTPQGALGGRHGGR